MASPAVPITADQLPPVPAKPAVDPEIERLQRQVATQDQTIRQMQSSMRVPQPQPAAPPPFDKAAADKEFFKNPLQGVAEIAHNISQATTQRALAELGPSFDTLKETASRLVRDKDPALFDKYEAQIRASVATTPAQFHQNVGTWQLAFDKVKGENLREILASHKPEAPRGPAIHVSSNGGPAAPSHREPAAPKGEKLSDQESEVARNLGISEGSYKRGKDAYQNQSERGKSSWDPYITFSSKEKRAKERADRTRSNKPAAA